MGEKTMNMTIDLNGKLWIQPDLPRILSRNDYEPTSSDLEKILQAVKMTQTKIVNKQIQTIQDSKNNGTITGVNKIEFTNGTSLVTVGEGLTLIDKNHKFKKVM